MKRAERLGQILERVVADGSAEVDALAAAFAVSASTIRRDLDDLAEQRLLQRTRGGARTHSAFNDLPLRFKVVHRLEEKRRIAARARDLIGPARVLGLTGGTTTTLLAELLRDRDDLTLVTNALNIAVDTLSGRGPRVFTAGGEARNASYETVGATAEEDLARFHLDIAFVGVNGVDPDAGCTVYDPMSARTNGVLARRARRVVVLADAEKVGRVAFTTACGLDAVDVLITDAAADRGVLARIAAAGVTPVVV